jgi:hypothetical protein
MPDVPPMKAKRTRVTARGRRRFKSKFASEESVFHPYDQHPRPYGWAWPVINIAGRHALLKYFLPVIKGQPAVPDVPLNFSQVANKLLGEKQTRLCNGELCKELDRFQMLNDTPSREHPCWNCPEVPPELLRKALSQYAPWAVQEYQVIQRALARLYAVAWFGRGSDSVEAKRQLEELLPKGRAYPVTKHIPELAGKFREMRRWIKESNELMKRDFPREIDRVKKLAELYDEPTGLISDALQHAETPFLTARLSQVLGIPEETVKKALVKQPPAS